MEGVVRASRRVLERGGQGPGSGANEPVDGVGGFLDLLDGRLVAELGGIKHAVLEMVVEQTSRDPLEGTGQGGDLGEDVDAVLIVIDHLPDAADLTFDPLHPPRESVLLRGVSMLLSHGHTVYPYGV